MYLFCIVFVQLNVVLQPLYVSEMDALLLLLLSYPSIWVSSMNTFSEMKFGKLHFSFPFWALLKLGLTFGKTVVGKYQPDFLPALPLEYTHNHCFGCDLVAFPSNFCLGSSIHCEILLLAHVSSQIPSETIRMVILNWIYKDEIPDKRVLSTHYENQ